MSDVGGSLVGEAGLGATAREQIEEAHNDPRVTARRDGCRDAPRVGVPYISRSRHAVREIRDGGLWDTQVRAVFEMTRDRRGTTAQVRRPTLKLVSVEARCP